MKSIGKWYIGFGLFLFICGVAGYLSNPEAAQTALISGSLFGAICAALGFGMHCGITVLRYVAGAVTLLLIAVFMIRSIISWQAVSAGEAKLFAASLITLMLIASLVSFVKLLIAGRAAHGA